VLATLSQHGEMTMSELTDLLAIDISVTSRHVAYVAEQGWLERSPNPADGRSRILRLTDAGRDLLDSFADHYADVLAEGLSGWSEDEVRELIRLMAKLHDSLICHRTTPSAPACAPASARATTHVRS
jgi:DNA-binding MarR family transcriptional regulator